MPKRNLQEIANLYLQGLTAREIAPMYGVSCRTIIRDLHKSGIEPRNPGALHYEQLDDVAWLRAQYNEGKSTTDIANMIGCGASLVSQWMRRYGLKMRSTGSSKGHNRCTESVRKKMSVAKRGKYLGEDNPNWRGGHTPNPERRRYKAKKWARQVKERDNFTCQDCGSTDRLHSHHIKRWMDYPELRYDIDNGITLCFHCHEKAHGKGFKFRFDSKQKMTRVHRSR